MASPIPMSFTGRDISAAMVKIIPPFAVPSSLVTTTIRGRNYTLRSDEDEDLPAIAGYVDRKMAEIAGRSTRVDDYTVAMLAALNIASEFEQFRKQVQDDLGSLDRDLASTAVLLEAAMPESAPSADG